MTCKACGIHTGEVALDADLTCNNCNYQQHVERLPATYLGYMYDRIKGYNAHLFGINNLPCPNCGREISRLSLDCENEQVALDLTSVKLPLDGSKEV